MQIIRIDMQKPIPLLAELIVFDIQFLRDLKIEIIGIFDHAHTPVRFDYFDVA